jgi:hypothetical protein
LIPGDVLSNSTARTTASPNDNFLLRPQKPGGAPAAIALLVSCVFFTLFIVHFGRWQYGAWDFNILVDTGWRQLLGQRPFTDFVTPNPPGFNLGILYAFKLFGLNWDANLYLTALFTCVTFLWMYWLMNKLSMGWLPSLAVACAIECAGTLTLCFWWYNDSTLILSAVFFLSCMAYMARSSLPTVQLSYVLSLSTLSLMKPNMAGLMIAGGVALLFVATDRRQRLALLTLAAAVAAIAVLLIHRVSIPAMVQSYMTAAKTRGGIAARFGWRQLPRSGQHAALLWVALLSVPLVSLVPKFLKQMGNRDWKGMALSLFFPLTLAVVLYGLITNGEYRDVECTVLLAAGGVLSFGLRWNGRLLRAFYVAMICLSILIDLRYGAQRTRVQGIGPHLFFEAQDNQQPIDSGFFKGMRVSSRMIGVEREIDQTIRTSHGPIFFGPRLEFNYVAFRLPSPAHLPVYWQPGTSFGYSQEAQLIRTWQEQRFETLIFLKEDKRDPEFSGIPFDATFYSKEFMNDINRDYVTNDGNSQIMVFHRRRPNL